MEVIALMGPLFTNHGLKADQDESDFLSEAALFSFRVKSEIDCLPV